MKVIVNSSIKGLDRILTSRVQRSGGSGIVIEPELQPRKRVEQGLLVDLRLAWRGAEKPVGLSIHQVFDPQLEFLIPCIDLGIGRAPIQKLCTLQFPLPDDLLFLVGEGHLEENLVIGGLEDKALAGGLVINGDAHQTSRGRFRFLYMGGRENLLSKQMKSCSRSHGFRTGMLRLVQVCFPIQDPHRGWGAVWGCELRS